MTTKTIGDGQSEINLPVMMMSWSELSPPAGSEPLMELTVGTPDVAPTQIAQQPTFMIKDLDFSKDESDAAGTGKITLFGDLTQFNLIKAGSQFLLKTGWKYPDGTTNLKEFISGIFTPTEIKGHDLTANISDNGYMLMAQGNVSYSGMKRSAIIEAIIVLAGLKAYINFGSIADDVISYSSATTTDSSTSSTGGPGTVCNSGPPSSGCGGGAPYSQTATKCWSSTCPKCHKPLLIPSWKAGYSNQITCGTEAQQKSGEACGSDFCCQTGYILDGTCSCKLAPSTSSSGTTAVGSTTSQDSTTATSDPTNATGSSDTTDSSSTTASTTQKTYWEMLLELTQPTTADLQVFVWMDTCYVQAIPDSTKAVLQIDETKNIIYDTVDLKEGDPTVTNTVIVTYGSGNSAGQVVAEESVYEAKYGEITNGTVPATTETVDTTDSTGVTKVKVKNIPKKTQKFDTIVNATKAVPNPKITKITQSKMNQAEATAYAWNQLGKLMRDDKFEIDVSVIGHPDFFICRWVKMTSPYYNIDKTYYIDKIDHKFDLNQGYYTDLTLLEYRPTMQIQQSTSDTSDPTGSGGDPATLAKSLGTAIACYDWVWDNVGYKFYMGGEQTPSQVIASKKANCYDQSGLLVAMLAAIGVSASRSCAFSCGGYPHCKTIVGNVIADTVHSCAGSKLTSL